MESVGGNSNSVLALKQILMALLQDLINFVFTAVAPKMQMLECMYIRQAIDLLQGLLPATEEKTPSQEHVSRLFIFAVMWSIGALLELEDRVKMESCLRSHTATLELPETKGEETIFEFVVNENGQWDHWLKKVPEYSYPKDSIPEYSSILVPNVDNVRTDFLMQTIMKQGKAVLLIVEQGTAKTVMVKGFTSKYDPEAHMTKSLNFSSATQPNMFQRSVESYIDKRMGTTYGPPAGKKMTLFIDDINMPVINEWGDQANLALQEARLIVAQTELNNAQQQLDEKQRELDEVQAMYDTAMREKQTLLDDAETCRRKMNNATALIEGLGGEKVSRKMNNATALIEGLGGEKVSRKMNNATALIEGLGGEKVSRKMNNATALIEGLGGEKNQINRLVGDVLLATGFLSYSGPFNQEYRNLLLQLWKKEMSTYKIPYSDELNLISMLVDNATIGEWNLQGLPNDDLSIQNGIIVTKASRYPLLIDPQGHGKIWIKNREKNNELQVTSLNHKYFRSHLEDCLSLGRPLLIEDVGEELDPALDNILENNVIQSGSIYKVKVGDKEVDVMKGFTLYITTKLANPAYTPEISARTAVIDFTVTMKGLEDQLLGRVILTEKQELEAERVKLLEEVTSNKRKMQELEDNLLFRLTSTQGSLVDDESLIEVLRITKTTAEEVSEKLNIAAETEVKINAAREEYRPVATRGSILYFLIVEMSLVNVMYQTSLRQFLGLFDMSMEKSVKSQITSKRIANIIEYLTYEVFRYTARGLYEDHKFLFTLLMALKIDLQAKKISHEEFQTLIKGRHIPKELVGGRLLFQETRVTARHYIAESLGVKYAEGVILEMEGMWIESDNRTPMVCFLSMGSDPTENIERLSKTKNTPCRAISMGQGQEVHARRLLNQSMQDGGWLLLQNCHLGLDFLDELLDTITTIESMHDGFRTWVTTEAHPKFPINLLQSSVKFTNEPPQGVKAGLKRTYSGITQEQLEISNMPQWKSLLYAVGFLHTTLQERRKFGPLGWNIPYEFNQADFTASVQFVQNHLDEMDIKRGVNWSCMRYMLGEVQYGGRVTYDLDKHLLNTFTQVWFGENMFSDKFCFYKGYVIPKGKTVQDYMEHIELLPLVDSPEVFGLHPNADITYQTNMANETLSTVVNIQPKDSASGGGETREATVQRLADEMLEKLPPDYIPHEVKARLQKMGTFQPMNIFLRQEIGRMQRIISRVRNTLIDLKLAIDVEAPIAALVQPANLSLLSKDAACPNKQCRVTEVILKKAYTASAFSARLGSYNSIRVAYQAHLIWAIAETNKLLSHQLDDLRLISRNLLRLSKLCGQAIGRNLAALVAAHRQLWLSQAQVVDVDKTALLDAPVTPGHTFGLAVDKMLQQSQRARESTKELVRLLPQHPPPPRKPAAQLQAHSWWKQPAQLRLGVALGSVTRREGITTDASNSDWGGVREGRGVQGTIIMSEDLRDALDNMYDARIPKLWYKISWESATLGFWFTELLERNQQFHTWLFDGRPNQFWMTGFFNPQGFLTAVRQETTRMNLFKGWALDSVILHNDVTRMMKEDVTGPPPVDIGGFGWDRRNTKLMESSPKVLFTSLPVVHVYAISSTAPPDPKKQQRNLYSCPVYKKPRCTDLTYIFSLYLKTTKVPDHWTLRGVALLCDSK
ncbi:UNVERIFIED_CONTAM: hypothetical protein FKN15_041268 [Acipenser sinensis]